MSTVDHQLGPFEAPKEFQFEPELLGKTPRIVPPELRQGHHGRSQFRLMRTLLIIGLLCLASAETSFVQTIGNYLLPLKFTRWIGGAFLLGSLFVYIRDSRESGPYRYVKEGVPFVARVVQMVCQPAAYYNGQPTSWKTFAAVEYLGADGAVVQEWTPSFDLGNRPQWFTTSYKVGDYVTGLNLPGASAGDERRLYGFLGLKPGLGVVDADPTGQLKARDHVRTLVLVFGVILGGFAAFVYCLRSFPITMPGGSYWLAALAACAVMGVPVHMFLGKQAQARLAAWEAANTAALARGEALLADPRGVHGNTQHTKGTTICVLICLYVVIVMSGLGLNAFFDKSTPEPRPIIIDKLIHTTWNGVIRDYSIKFHLVDLESGKPTGSEESFLTTPEHMSTLKNRGALAMVKKGAFGWPWVTTIVPFETYRDVSAPSPEQGAEPGTVRPER